MILIALTKSEKIRHQILECRDLTKISDTIFLNKQNDTIEGRVYGEHYESLKKGVPPQLEEAPRGEYSVLNINEKEINLYVDPNGYRHIYLYSADDLEVVSNDFEGIFNFLKKLKLILSPSYETTLASLLMGVAFYPGTGIREIKLLNTNQYINIDIANEVLCVKNRNYIEYADLVFNKKIPRSDLLQIVIERLKQTAQEILTQNSSKEKIVEVTGGSDSRLVLGTLLANNFKDFKVYTFGKIDSLDQRVSQQIQNLFNLQSINYVNDLTKLHAAQNRWMITAGAFLPVDISYRSAFKRDAFLSFAGTGGELGRGYFTKQTYNKNYNSRQDIKIVDDVSSFRKLIENYSLRHLLTDEFKWLIATESANYYKDFPYSKELHMLLDYAFFQSRLRWHFGKQTELRDQLFIETPAIMNDFLFHMLIFSVNHIERISDKNVYDLLNLLYPPLNYLPFTNPPKFDENVSKRMFINLPQQRTSTPLKCIDRSKGIDRDAMSDREEIETIFYEFIENENYNRFIIKDKFVSIMNSQKKDIILDKFAPLLYWHHNTKFSFR